MIELQQPGMDNIHNWSFGVLQQFTKGLAEHWKRMPVEEKEVIMGEYKPWTKHGRNMDDPWINVSITGCAYRAELILGR